MHIDVTPIQGHGRLPGHLLKQQLYVEGSAYIDIGGHCHMPLMLLGDNKVCE